jgi:threonine dehydratase
MEHLQFTGSFKIRGMTNVFRVHEKKIKSQGAVTLSAGNAGRSFAFLCGQMNVKSTVCMPISVPPERVTIIQVTYLMNKNLCLVFYFLVKSFLSHAKL